MCLKIIAIRVLDAFEQKYCSILLLLQERRYCIMLGNKQEDTDLLFCKSKTNNKITSLPDQTGKNYVEEHPLQFRQNGQVAYNHTNKSKMYFYSNAT